MIVQLLNILPQIQHSPICYLIVKEALSINAISPANVHNIPIALDPKELS